MVFPKDALDTYLAGYLANLKAGHRVSSVAGYPVSDIRCGRIPDIRCGRIPGIRGYPAFFLLFSQIHSFAFSKSFWLLFKKIFLYLLDIGPFCNRISGAVDPHSFFAVWHKRLLKSNKQWRLCKFTLKIWINLQLLVITNFLAFFLFLFDNCSSVAETEPVEPKLCGDLEPEPKINLNKHFLPSVWRMLGRRKAYFYLDLYSTGTTVIEQL